MLSSRSTDLVLGKAQCSLSVQGDGFRSIDSLGILVVELSLFTIFSDFVCLRSIVKQSGLGYYFAIDGSLIDYGLTFLSNLGDESDCLYQRVSLMIGGESYM